MKILFIGDIFGTKGKEITVKLLPQLIKKHNINFVIAQGENITDRKGLNRADYNLLKQAGVNAFTMGNHVWAISEVLELIKEGAAIIPPLNSNENIGKGSQVFTLENGKTLRVTSLMGITFNKLLDPWKQKFANNFFDAIDDVLKEPTDYNFVDFHAETTSEKNVLALYLDGKVNAVVGTHTHVQTNDARTLPKGTAYITDVGMTGPHNCAIGANYKEVYDRMRSNIKAPFVQSFNEPQFNAVVISMSAKKNQIAPIRIDPE